jgi:hypothetical protein
MAPRAEGTPPRHQVGFDLVAEDLARFRVLCRERGTDVAAEIRAMIAAELADPDQLLSEALYVRVSPELKRQILEYVKKRHVTLGTVLMEAVAELERRREKPEVRGNRHRGPVGENWPAGLSSETTKPSQDFDGIRNITFPKRDQHFSILVDPLA